MQTEQRLAALLDHLQLTRVHFATQVPGDLAGFAAAHPERIGGLVLCTPTRLDPAPFAALAPRLLMIAGERGLSAEATRRAQAHLPAAQRAVLAGYEATGWSDVVAERTAEVVRCMLDFLGGTAATAPVTCGALPARRGTHAGLSYRVSGAGPPLLLLPFFLAPSQWEPARAGLAARFTLVELGGAHLGGVAALEDRARSPSYRAMFRTLVDLLAPQPGDPILDVGAGSGALDRLLAQWLGAGACIDAVDHNRFLLREAAQLAAADRRIRFAAASALALPFADRTFAAIYSVTVLEECDADAALAEMARVARPGARIGVAVRAIDFPQWWNMPLTAPIRAKADVPPQSVGPGGVADASLYARMRRAGLVDLTAFPALITLADAQGPMWRYREDHVLSQLSPIERAEWAAARAAAAEAGVLLSTHVLHCAVATRP